MEKATDNNQGGGGGTQESEGGEKSPSKGDFYNKTVEPEKKETNEKPKEESDLGYGDDGEEETKTPDGKEGGDKGPKSEGETEEVDDVKPPGYGDNEEEEEVDPKKEKKDGEEESEEVDYAPILKELSEHDDKDKVGDFIKNNGFTAEQAKAIVEARNEEFAAAEAADAKDEEDRQLELKQRRSELRKKYKSELKNDPEFGGENYNRTLSKVGKVLRDFFPTINNRLTKSKSMLSPSDIKDFARLADKVYGTEKLVTGGKGEEKEEKKHKPYDFYNKPEE